MLVRLPARLDDQIKEIVVNTLHVVSVIPTDSGSCQVQTTVLVFYVQLPLAEVVSRLDDPPRVEVRR